MSHPLVPTPSEYERDCVLYLRKSKGRAGIARQRNEAQITADRLRWRIVAEFVDTDATAFTKVGAKRLAYRDDYQNMLTMLRGDRRDKPLGVLGWHADRLHRNPVEIEAFIEVCAAGVHPVETARSGGYELWTATGRKRIRQDGVDAAYEVDHLIERAMAQRAEVVAAGGWGGGKVPFGWDSIRVNDDTKKLVLNAEQAAVIEWGSYAVLRGVPLAEIGREWSRRGVLNRSGKPWNTVTVGAVLRRARNAGLMLHQGRIVETGRPDGKAEWEPIISEDVWRAVVAVLDDPARRSAPGGTARRWLGSGIYLCGAILEDGGMCGSDMRSATTTSRGLHDDPNRRSRTVYRCRRAVSSHLARDAVNLDAYVESVLIARLSRPDVRAWLAAEEPPDVEATRARLGKEQAELGEWRRLAEAGEIEPVSFARAEKGALARIAAIKQELAASETTPLLADLVEAEDVAALWDGEDLAWRRGVLRTLVTVTVLATGKGQKPGWRRGQPNFDTTAIRFDWKQLGGVRPPA